MNLNADPKYKDILQKHASNLFKEGLLKAYGIETGKIKGIVNIELPMIEVSELSTDYIFLLEDDSYLHLEFQSDSSSKDMARFSIYDAALYIRDGKIVRTVIIHLTRLPENHLVLNIGTLKYAPEYVVMDAYDGEQVFRKLEKKVMDKEELNDVDMSALYFLPVMNIPRENRVKMVQGTIKIAKSISNKEKRDSIIAASILFSHKFLNENELNIIKEELRMTDLYHKILIEGEEKGIEKGKKERDKEIVMNMIKEGVPEDKIVKIVSISNEELNRMMQEFDKRTNVFGKK